MKTKKQIKNQTGEKMKKEIIAYKLVKLRKDKSLGPLFINRRQRIHMGVWLEAEYHPTKGYKPRKGWHCCQNPIAPHLTMNNRVWVRIAIKDYTELKRPESQGGLWYIANKIRFIDLAHRHLDRMEELEEKIKEADREIKAERAMLKDLAVSWEV